MNKENKERFYVENKVKINGAAKRIYNELYFKTKLTRPEIVKLVVASMISLKNTTVVEMLNSETSLNELVCDKIRTHLRQSDLRSSVANEVMHAYKFISNNRELINSKKNTVQLGPMYFVLKSLEKDVVSYLTNRDTAFMVSHFMNKLLETAGYNVNVGDVHGFQQIINLLTQFPNELAAKEPHMPFTTVMKYAFRKVIFKSLLFVKNLTEDKAIIVSR